MGKKRKLAFEIADMMCENCTRSIGCNDCPVHKLVEIYNIKDNDETEDKKYVERTLISEQQLQYLIKTGVVEDNESAADIVIYPENMEHTTLLADNMHNDLIKSEPTTIRFDEYSRTSPDIRIEWIIPEWLFMDRQCDILRTYFGREDL